MNGRKISQPGLLWPDERPLWKYGEIFTPLEYVGMLGEPSCIKLRRWRLWPAELGGTRHSQGDNR